jgi:hypothetical protein
MSKRVVLVVRRAEELYQELVVVTKPTLSMRMVHV